MRLNMKPMRHWLRVLVLVTAFAPVGALAAGDPATKDAAAREPTVVARESAKAYYTEGLKLYNLGRYEDALANFEKGYLAKPDPAFLFNLGQCYRMMHKHEDEIRQYRAYLRARPDAPNRADVEKFIAQAEEDLKKQVNPTQPTGTIEPATPAATPVEKQPDAAQQALTTGPQPAAAATPIYKKWWLWTIVGVVVVGAGVGLGIGLTQNNPTVFPGVTF